MKPSPSRQKALATSVPAPGPRAIRQAPAAAAPASFRVARVEQDDMLNVRSGPSDDHDAIGIISPNGRGVMITGSCVGDWCPVRHAGISGWVNRYYLAAE
jgi:uncharacterized protein YraI